MTCAFCNGEAYASGYGGNRVELDGDHMRAWTPLRELFDFYDIDPDGDEEPEAYFSMRLNYCPYCGDEIWRGTEPWTGWFGGYRKEQR